MITIPIYTFILLVVYSIFMLVWHTHVFARELAKIANNSSFIIGRWKWFSKFVPAASQQNEGINTDVNNYSSSISTSVIRFPMENVISKDTAQSCQGQNADQPSDKCPLEGIANSSFEKHVPSLPQGK